MRALLVSLCVLVACKRAPEPEKPLTVEDACAKLLSFRGDAGKRPSEKERCLAEYRSMEPKVRTCTDACVKSSPNIDQFEDCRDLCNGGSVPPFLICGKITFETAPFQACMKKHEALQKEHPDLYACWSRCGRRAKEGPDAAGCDATCKVP